MLRGKLIVLLCLTGTFSVLAQGTLIFANFATGVNAPVTNSVGQRITAATPGGDYVADLFETAY